MKQRKVEKSEKDIDKSDEPEETVPDPGAGIKDRKHQDDQDSRQKRKSDFPDNQRLFGNSALHVFSPFFHGTTAPIWDYSTIKSGEKQIFPADFYRYHYGMRKINALAARKRKNVFWMSHQKVFSLTF